jgi:Ser/Thr protein kinase RdoA (MazF antagonist)
VGSDSLTAQDVVRLLVDIGLLTTSHVVDDQLSIHRFERRNLIFRVEPANGMGFVVKQARTPMAEATVRSEAVFLHAFLEKNAGVLSREIPRFRYYDPARGILITELVPGRSFALGSLPLSDITRGQMTALGEVLSALHGAILPPGTLPGPQIPLGIALYRPTLDLYRDSSPANIQLLAAIRGDECLREHLSKLHDSWTTSTMIHGDVRLENVVAHGHDEREAIVLVDWETVGSGEPRWDVACALGDLLNLWLISSVSRELGSPASPDQTQTATQALDQVRSLVTALLEGYLDNSAADDNSSLFRQCFSFSAARLLQIVYESHQLRSDLDLYAVKAVQMAANIAADSNLVSDLFLSSEGF